ncbi:MAG: PAS domain S-box protein [Candidatus Hydrothermarchaeales archaeon]
MKASFIEGLKTKEYLQLILDSSPYAVISTDLEGRIISFNKAAIEMYGYEEGEVMGKHVRILQPKKTSQDKKKEIYERMLKNEGWEGEILNKRKNGEVFPVYLKTKVLEEEDGEIIGLLIFAADISGKKKTEEKFGLVHELSESIIEYAPIGIFTLDQEWRITSLNPALLKILGAKKTSDVKGIDFRETPMYNALGGRALEEWLMKEGAAEVSRVQYTSLYGKRSFVDASATALKKEGKFIGSLFLIQDIEEQMMLEEELKSLALELDYSNKLKELFIDIIRHDLISPLGIIKNYAEFLVEEERDEEKKKELVAIENNAQRLLSLIKEIKMFTKLENEEGREYTILNMTSSISELIESFKTQLAGKDMSINFSSSGEFLIKANPFIDDVFSNIISNAIKYSPNRTEIDIAIKDFDDVWRIQFKDQGAGIPGEEKIAIFERFKRIKKGNIKGTGLGLAIVKRVVEMHSGKVWVEDNPSGGSIFIVEIPKAEGV